MSIDVDTVWDEVTNGKVSFGPLFERVARVFPTEPVINCHLMVACIEKSLSQEEIDAMEYGEFRNLCRFFVPFGRY